MTEQIISKPDIQSTGSERRSNQPHHFDADALAQVFNGRDSLGMHTTASKGLAMALQVSEMLHGFSINNFPESGSSDAFHATSQFSPEQIKNTAGQNNISDRATPGGTPSDKQATPENPAHHDSPERLKQAEDLASQVAYGKKLTNNAVRALDADFSARTLGLTPMADLINAQLKDKGMEIKMKYDLPGQGSPGSRTIELVDTWDNKTVDSVNRREQLEQADKLAQQFNKLINDKGGFSGGKAAADLLQEAHSDGYLKDFEDAVNKQLKASGKDLHFSTDDRFAHMLDIGHVSGFLKDQNGKERDSCAFSIDNWHGRRRR